MGSPRLWSLTDRRRKGSLFARETQHAHFGCSYWPPESLVIEQQAGAPRLESWPSIESGDTPLNVGPSEVLPPLNEQAVF